MRIVIVLLTTALAAGPALARTEECDEISTAEVARLFDRWNASLATLDPKRVAANYAKGAVLLPTVSNLPRTTPALIEDYFVMFLKQKPQGRIDERHITIGCDVATDVGVYTFTLANPDGTTRQVKARYSFVYVPEGGQWKILHHHSSAMPEPVR
ncbi:MAG: SgcJ/EcaC family oxidoreductase [Sphingomonadaceae bacterium]|uniref:SgcJ/EcaC family oxidoreductase n=1 Tax=Thermaurantiacus sp. TaxID=2820283 RepID=UPI00298EF259|nr:SgcJ/EcaC family oxidoreductase [Thermaurantiacus sp.]MCS6986027.1 SgcJ/EcaC family oxidoreductase [Sphingomonadaceae bacterium]MDW8414757.1 SgcJ/EcaC family oxidoreductase [Thermaurantiacus sp.]